MPGGFIHKHISTMICLFFPPAHAAKAWIHQLPLPPQCGDPRHDRRTEMGPFRAGFSHSFQLYLQGCHLVVLLRKYSMKPPDLLPELVISLLGSCTSSCWLQLSGASQPFPFFCSLHSGKCLRRWSQLSRFAAKVQFWVTFGAAGRPTKRKPVSKLHATSSCTRLRSLDDLAQSSGKVAMDVSTNSTVPRQKM